MDNRIVRVKNIARDEADKSPCLHKHGAVISKGKHIFTSGHNTYFRNSFMSYNCEDYCIHAEMAAANSFINIFQRTNPKLKIKKYTIWCVRISKDGFINSSPCIICLERLKKIGFGKIGFSDSDGNIKQYKLDTFESFHYSSGFGKIKNI